MKKRSILVMVLLGIVTCGLYILYWYCSFQNQLKKTTGLGFGGFGHLLATIFTFGIYIIIWTFKVGERIEKAGGSNSGVLYLILTILGLGVIAYLLMQNDVNTIAQ